MRRRAAGRLAVLAVLALGWLLGAAGSASAHPALVSSTPGAGYAVTDSPREIALAFNEPVTLPDPPLVLKTADGREVRLRVIASQGGTGLVGTPASPLPVGAYEATYRVVGRDGDLISGAVAFGVATPVGPGRGVRPGRPAGRACPVAARRSRSRSGPPCCEACCSSASPSHSAAATSRVGSTKRPAACRARGR